MSFVLYLSLFMSALVSGWHCALMCSGVASWAETKVIRIVSPTQMRWEQLLMHLCRISAYALLGALAGGFGAIFWRQDALPIQKWMFILGSILLLINAVMIAFAKNEHLKGIASWRVFQIFEAKAAGFWANTAGRLDSGKSSTNLSRRMAIGFLWGFIPCGLVYSTLPLAFLSGSALSGAGLMVAMGLGTLPNLLLISGLVGKIAGSVAQFGHANWARWVVAGLMAIAGGMGLYRAFTLTEDFLKGGFCFS